MSVKQVYQPTRDVSLDKLPVAKAIDKLRETNPRMFWPVARIHCPCCYDDITELSQFGRENHVENCIKTRVLAD